MKKVVILLPLLLVGILPAQKKKPVKSNTTTAVVDATKFTDDQKASYYIGADIAQNLKNQGFNIDVNLLTLAMKEHFEGKKATLPAEESQSFMQTYMQKMNEKRQAEAKIKSEENKKKGAEFLAKNKQNPAIKSTASGLQYEVLKEGDGVNKPSATDIVKVTYKGQLLDGTVFDSTEKNGGQPIEFPLNGVIKGWTEGIQLMSKGAKYKFYIPADLAYGDRGAGNVIKPGELLTFEVELLDYKPQEKPKEIQAAEVKPAAAK